MLRLIGIGLRDGDISCNGKAALAAADAAYAELYTNSIDYNLDALAQETGTEITVLDREGVENNDTPLQEAKAQDVAFLVSGDPLAATTHQDILFRARAQGIETEIYHAPSIMVAVAETGLSLYKFGRTTTLTTFNGAVPGSVLDAIQDNRERGLHTLILLDIGMTLETAADLLADHIPNKVLACTRLGTAEARCQYSRLEALSGENVPAALIVPGDLGEHEKERLQQL